MTVTCTINTKSGKCQPHTESTNYSYTLGSIPERMARFREAVQLTTHLLRSDAPLDFQGAHYSMHEAVLLRYR